MTAGTQAGALAAPPRPRPGDPPTRASDALEGYLREIGRVPLLTAEQEVELANAMRAGVQAAKLAEGAGGLDIPALVELARQGGLWSGGAPSAAVAAELCEVLQRRGRAARAKLIEANLRLVVSIAKRYRGRQMTLLDLIQEGNLGLIRGVEKFDASRGFKLSTYATWWIRQNITRALADRDRAVRLPVHVVASVQELKRTQRDLVQALGRHPGVDDLAAGLGIGPQEVQRLLAASKATVSLDAPIGDQTSARLGDLIEDTTATPQAELVVTQALREQLDGVLASFSEQERRVIELRFGLADGVPRTLDQVGCIVGLSRDRVRHVERRTLCKLRHPSAAHALVDFAG